MGCPAKVAGDGDPKEPGLVDDLKRFMMREMELREEVKLFGEVEGENFGLLVVDLHLVLFREHG